MRSWKFATAPFWVFSHFFALSVVVLFIGLGLWQLDRLDQRQAQNDLILGRADEPAASLADILEAPVGSREFRRVEDRGRFVNPDLARIGSQTQGGLAGDHVVALVELQDGTQVLVNRGFVPLTDLDRMQTVADGEVTIEGWVRQSQSKDGVFGADDGQRSQRLPRFNVPTLADRAEGPVADVWIQLETDPTALGSTGQTTAEVVDRAPEFPAPVPLPPLDEGNHLSYAVQWFIFALLGTAFYLAVVWRRARLSP